MCLWRAFPYATRKSPLQRVFRFPLIEGGPATAEEAVVFVHGNLGSSRDWEDLAAQISPFGRALRTGHAWVRVGA